MKTDKQLLQEYANEMEKCCKAIHEKSRGIVVDCEKYANTYDEYYKLAKNIIEDPNFDKAACPLPIKSEGGQVTLGMQERDDKEYHLGCLTDEQLSALVREGCMDLNLGKLASRLNVLATKNGMDLSEDDKILQTIPLESKNNKKRVMRTTTPKGEITEAVKAMRWHIEKYESEADESQITELGSIKEAIVGLWDRIDKVFTHTF